MGIPPRILGLSMQVCCAAPAETCAAFPASLLQRLNVELPQIYAALILGGENEDPHSEMSSPAFLVESVRQARDGLLTLASSSKVSSDDLTKMPKHLSTSTTLPSGSLTSGQETSSTTSKPAKPPRKTSLSHWTE